MSDLALAESQDLTTLDEEQLVTMTVDNQLFGIPILKVQDIVEPDQITPVPQAPGAIAGVLNLRGRIVTVIDLRECLGAPEAEETKQMSVTVEYKGDLYTLLVDSIGDVRSLPRKNFDKPPATLADNLRSLCSGIFQLEHDLLVVLDVERILDEETIMKTPRRTRKRRKIELIEQAKTKVETESVETEEADEQDNCAPEKPKTKPATKNKPASPAPAAKKSAAPAPKKESAAVTEPEPEEEEAAEDSFTPPPSEDLEARALQAVEAYAAKIDSDPILNDLFKDVGDPEMLDLLMALFNAAFEVPGAGKLEPAYMTLINQPGLGDDHFMQAGTAMHSTLTEMKLSPEETDKIMRVIDEVRIKVLDT
ncbi:chemotaxis protein CheW [Aestuariispira insulae]|uniref:Chemotaxis signal transduction protein n=1 Tax=Aestuariispira insulae TaxID=1461337 RepID=A0A3D9HJQ4_9PROT|nr:chemotaxis protein CheW [Aestuariispira insulae]RED49698.1 chemotaxis signal transduction protein [Aestuariispira insulae]